MRSDSPNLCKSNGPSFSSRQDSGKGNACGKHGCIDATDLRTNAQDLIDEALERVGVAFIRLGRKLQQRVVVYGSLFARRTLLCQPT
jgi:hypothetical protein